MVSGLRVAMAGVDSIVSKLRMQVGGCQKHGLFLEGGAFRVCALLNPKF